MGEFDDLAQFDEEFKKTEVKEGGDFDPVPDGKYDVAVQNIELTRTKKEPPRPMVKWTLEITGPDHIGRLLWKNSVIGGESLAYLKKDLHAAGLKVTKVSDLVKRLGELQGVALSVTVKSRDNNTNVYINKRLDAEEAEDEADVPF